MKKAGSLQKQVMAFLIMTLVLLTAVLSFAAIEIVGRDKDKDISMEMNILTANEAEKLDQDYIRFEDAVNHMTSITDYYIDSAEAIKDPAKRQHIDGILQQLYDRVSNTTNMSLGYYCVYNPDLVGNRQGFFYVRNAAGNMEKHEMATISDFDADDIERVGWYKKPVKAGKAVWLPPYFNKNTRRYTISYCSPLYKDGVLVAVIGMDFNFETLLNVVDRIQFSKSGYAYLKSADGKIHYHAHDFMLGSVHGDENLERVRNGELLSQETSGKDVLQYWKDGSDRVQTFTTLRCGLQLVLCDDYDEIYMGRYKLLTVDILVIVVCGLVIIGLIYYYTRRITQPIKKLTEAVNLIKEGQYDVELPTNAPGEIGVLTQGVAMAAAALGEKNRLNASALAAQNRKLEKAVKKANEASRAKSDFLSRMSHDIRTPMNAIVGMGMIAESHKDDPVKLTECLRKISTSSKYLLNLINEVLDMSRIESGNLTMTKAPVNIPELIGSIVAMIGPQLKDHRHNITTTIKDLPHETVLSDSLRMQQVFVNILSNAIKYTPDGGNISLMVREIHVSASRSMYVFSFKDNGIGMSPEFQEKMFQPFARAQDDHETEVKGTGLGMSITKAIVDLLGGTISVKSALNKGTEITVKLDLEFVEDSAEGSKTSRRMDFSEIHLEGKRILLVDDILLNLEIAENLLEMTGAEMDKAGNGKEAVDMFMEKGDGYYDLIFMDARMPIMDGYAATRSIRTMDSEYAHSIPIIAMSADAFAEDIENFMKCGMNDYVSKPIDLKNLARVLQKHLL
ncbi:hybrid sensor histidine kinase/response regulator [Anaerovibrio sp. RM50]|uniref:hybrid sensor histidine kinase/response regulator n=1 Tax=Anaerovibrio sp. RM50 TaxID=1200557 RepID=UPI00068400E1|nr:hybrid sensor histidine kinase/response regulator [Anaerovibrio sp. RM50]